MRQARRALQQVPVAGRHSLFTGSLAYTLPQLPVSTSLVGYGTGPYRQGVGPD